MGRWGVARLKISISLATSVPEGDSDFSILWTLMFCACQNKQLQPSRVFDW